MIERKPPTKRMNRLIERREYRAMLKRHDKLIRKQYHAFSRKAWKRLINKYPIREVPPHWSYLPQWRNRQTRQT